MKTWNIISRFTGWQTLLDPTKIDEGACAEGVNTTANNGDRISVRNLGYEFLPNTSTASAATDPIKSLHTFRKRGGTNIMMRSNLTLLEYYHQTSGTWATLNTGYTTGLKFGFADYNINADLVSYVYFGNGVENYSRWNGAITEYASSTVNTITKEGSSTWASLGFSATGSVIIGGTTYAYTGGTATTTLTGVTPDPSGAGYTAGQPVAQIVTTYASGPKGNIFINANNRIFVAGDPNNQQSVYFTKYGDATDFTGITTLITDSTATAAGYFNLGEGGGGVTDMVLDEGSIYIFKKAIVYKATLSDSLYTLVPLKPFDSKSQTMGAQAGTVFVGGNSVFLITPDRQILSLERVEQIDYPQVSLISYLINDPSTNQFVFDASEGIVFRNKAFITCKSSIDATVNDIVLVWNILQKFWDTPITGWNVTDFCIYDDGNGEELYFASSNSTNVYKVITDPVDDVYNVGANWRTKQYNFGLEAEQKVQDSVFIEGYIDTSTTLTVSLLLDEEGFTQTYTGTIAGTDTGLLFSSADFNVYGFEVFGGQMFGSNDDESGQKKFRVYFTNKVRAVPFYTAQLDFSSNGANQQWEVINYGFHVEKWSDPMDRDLKRSFT